MNASDERVVKQSLERVDVLRFGVGIALSILSGVMLLLSFPPYNLWPLMWIGFIPMLIAQYRLLPRRWSSLAVAIADLVWLAPFLYRVLVLMLPGFIRI